MSSTTTTWSRATCGRDVRSFFEGLPVFGTFGGLAAVLFLWGVSMSDVEYFTTWALAIHGSYFALIALDEWLAWFFRKGWTRRFSRESWQTRWVFVPCMTIATSVAVSVTYLLLVLWDEETTDEHCADSVACRDLFVEFIVAHYGPLLAYLMAYTLKAVFVGKPSRTPPPPLPLSSTQSEAKSSSSSPTTTCFALDERTRYLVAVFQVSLFPTLVYASFMDPDVVYGSGASTGGVVAYVVTNALWTGIVAYPLSTTTTTI